MPEPKISRHCPTCHVLIRDQAFFCPQCGNKLERPKSPPAEESSEIHVTEEIIIDGNQTLTESDFRARAKEKKAPPAEESAEIHDTEEIIIDSDQTLTEWDFRGKNKEKKAPEDAGKPQTRQRALGEVGSKIQRVTTKARDVEGDVKQRVQKFREISSVVIDEASYDPSLRFVLVAAVLFVLFLVIGLLNKLIG